MKHYEWLGHIAGLLTTVSYLPQVIYVWRTRSVKDISLPMYALLSTGICLWAIYGILEKRPSLIIANLIALAFSLSIMVMKIRGR